LTWGEVLRALRPVIDRRASFDLWLTRSPGS
jgi:hypothetical protein